MKVGRFVDAAAEARFRAVYATALAELPEPAGSTQVATDFGRVHTYRFGTGAGVPLVLLPGRAGSTTMWGANLPAWAAERTVHAIEVLGEPGLSVQERPIRSAADQSRWLGQALAGLGLERAHLVGVSFGGWLATNLALHDASRIASLSLIDPACVFARFPVKLLVLAAVGGLPGVPATVREKVITWISGGNETSDHPAGRVIDAGIGGFRMAVPPPSYPAAEQLRALRLPVLALIAGRSVIHDPQRAYARALDVLRDGDVQLWPEASHAINGECAERVNRAVLEFIRGVDSRRWAAPSTSSGTSH